MAAVYAPHITRMESPMATNSITAYIAVHDAAAALDFYTRAFGAVEKYRIPWEGRIGHAELSFGGHDIFLSDEAPDLGAVSAKALGGSNIAFVLDVDDLEAAWDRAVAAGATVDRPISEAPYGTGGWHKDPFGVRWNLTKSNPDFDPKSRGA
jgi:PhnB protein